MCGMPQRVFSTGILQEGLVNHVHTQYVYGQDGPAVSCVSGGIAANGFQFGHGFELYLEDATILFDAGTYGGEWVLNRPLTLVTNDGKAETPELVADEAWYAAFTTELQAATAAIDTQTEPPVLSGAMALDALKLCHAEADSIKLGGTVAVA